VYPRTIVALVLLTGAAAAFAPLPFPRPKKPAATSLETMTGLWRIASQQAAAGEQEFDESRMFVEIRSGRWTFLDADKERSGRGYQLKLHGDKKPVWLDVLSGGPGGFGKGGPGGRGAIPGKGKKKGPGPSTPMYTGLVEVSGDRMVVTWTRRGERPKTFRPEGDAIRYMLERIKNPPGGRP
jgi:uncharacterized protein (TIGR03067 family)